MKYVYIVIDRNTGFIFGAYANREHAHAVFEILVKEGAGKDICISQEPIIEKSAHFPIA